MMISRGWQHELESWFNRSGNAYRKERFFYF